MNPTPTPAAAAKSPFLLGSAGGLTRHINLSFTFGLFGIVVLMVLPISPFFIDFLLALSIGISLFVLLVVIYVQDPSEFSLFPTLLLAVTLFRLGLNVASTRLILLNGFAGSVIDTFGNFVVQGNYVVGAVVFTILVIINFVVITKGAGRIAEVAARFTLDALPGKQMSIDAELNAGLIDDKTAKERRLQIQKDADFYGAMDGASKFVRGDAIAGILITAINVLGGISIGVFQKDLSLMAALQKYSLLSIGDGLVAQIPALIVSVAAGILITRSSEGTDLSEHVGQQVTRYPKALGIAGVMLLIFSLLPGMPVIPFMALALICLISGQAFAKEQKRKAEEEAKAEALQQKQEGIEGLAREPKDLKEAVQMDRFSIEIGYGLLNLADKKAGGDLLDRVTGVRQKLARDLGLILPLVSVRDNLELGNYQYRFLLRDKEVAMGELHVGQWMAMNTGQVLGPIRGTPTKEPVFGLDAYWVDNTAKQEAERMGYTLVDATSVMITHLTETIKSFAHLVLEREDVQKLVDAVKEKNPTLISELLPDLVSVGLIQRVLQNLIKEGVSIRNLTLIFETIADFAPITKSADDLSEQARKRLGIYFVEQLAGNKESLDALLVAPELEQILISRIQRTQFETGLMMDPELTVKLTDQLRPLIEKLTERDLPQVILTSSELRLPLKRFLEPSFPRLAVLGYSELPHDLQVQSQGMLTA